MLAFNMRPTCRHQEIAANPEVRQANSISAKNAMNAPRLEVDNILDAARDRGRKKSLTYAGEVTPHEAHQLFVAAGAKIIDVRYHFEPEYIGRIPGSMWIPWKLAPGGDVNPDFLPALRQHCARDDVVLFLCRSGVRSHAAAALASEAGFTRTMNILEGFEGNLDAGLQRGNTGGWRCAGLPWIQS